MSASRKRGTAWETAVAGYLRDAGFPGVERRAPTGAADRGDLSGLPAWTIECKAEKAISLATYLDEAKTEAANDGAPYYAAVVKRRNRPTSDAYVVLDLATFAQVLTDLSRPTEAPSHDRLERLIGLLLQRCEDELEAAIRSPATQPPELAEKLTAMHGAGAEDPMQPDNPMQPLALRETPCVATTPCVDPTQRP